MRIISYFFILIIVLFGMSFATLNSDTVTINYYFAQSSMPLSLLLVIAFAFGCLIGILVGSWLLLKAKVSNYRLRHRLASIEKEVEHLRVTPLRDTN